jgi:hypothetical protein
MVIRGVIASIGLIVYVLTNAFVQDRQATANTRLNAED